MNENRVAAEREFRGAGPVVSWDASSGLIGGEDAGRVSVDWSLSGGLLFGRQNARAVEETSGREITGTADETNFFRDQYEHTIQETVKLRDDSTSVQVPTVGASLGLSYTLDRLKVGAGYRWERYFDVIDGGIEERKTYDRTIDGPYFKLAVGFGG